MSEDSVNSKSVNRFKNQIDPWFKQHGGYTQANEGFMLRHSDPPAHRNQLAETSGSW